MRMTILAAGLWLALTPAGLARDTGMSWIDLVQREGVEVVGLYQPGIVVLSSTGHICPDAPPVFGLPAMPETAREQAELSACSLKARMAEAKVEPAEIVEARISVLDAAEAAEILEPFASDPDLAGAPWRVVLVERLPGAHSGARLSVDIAAISPDSGAAIADLPFFTH